MLNQDRAVCMLTTRGKKKIKNVRKVVRHFAVSVVSAPAPVADHRVVDRQAIATAVESKPNVAV